MKNEASPDWAAAAAACAAPELPLGPAAPLTPPVPTNATGGKPFGLSLVTDRRRCRDDSTVSGDRRAFFFSLACLLLPPPPPPPAAAAAAALPPTVLDFGLRFAADFAVDRGVFTPPLLFTVGGDGVFPPRAMDTSKSRAAARTAGRLLRCFLTPGAFVPAGEPACAATPLQIPLPLPPATAPPPSPLSTVLNLLNRPVVGGVPTAASFKTLACLPALPPFVAFAENDVPAGPNVGERGNFKSISNRAAASSIARLVVGEVGDDANGCPA